MSSDTGLFGPGSVTWKVHASPTMLIGGFRALIVQSLHPLALAGVVLQSDFRDRPLHRLQRTARYVATVTFSDTETAREAGARVARVHSRIRGVDPVTGREYSAGDVDTLLWVHCCEVHSFMAGFRAYGGSLTADEQDRYLAESARAAEVIGIPPERVPASRAAMAEYFAAMEPELIVSDHTRETVRFVLRPPVSRELLALLPALRITGEAAHAIVPRHVRRRLGIDRPWLLDTATHLSVGTAARALATAMRLPGIGDGVNAAQRAVFRTGDVARAA